MARLPRLILPGQPHHVILRGNNRQAIFFSDLDRQHLLATLAEVSTLYNVGVHAYVLMDNHFHLLVTPVSADALSRMMQALGRRYVGWFNARHQRSGTLWEGRFRAGLRGCTEDHRVHHQRVRDPGAREWLGVEPQVTGVVARADACAAL